MTFTAMNYTVNSSSFDSRWSAFSTNIIDVCLVLYGIYLVLFILAIHTLARRKSGAKNLLLGYTWTMIIFGTVQLLFCLGRAIVTAHFVEVLVKEDVTGNFTSQPELVKLATVDHSPWITAQEIIFAGNNLVTDTLLLYRCFVICGSDWRPVVLPAVLMACTFVAGCVDNLVAVPATIFRLPFIFAALTNLVLMAFIGGRIWYIRQDAQLVARDELRKQYDTVIAMILESGAVYFLVLVLLAIFASDSSGTAFNVLQSIAMHAVNIAPTLIIVRVGLGQNIQDTGKATPVNEAGNMCTQPREEFSVYRMGPPIPHMLDIKASDDDILTP
ncbi:hypothetical protein B0H16DRAFT_598993 [Mycena metata]|uniref:Uncharacterized protein n=1 Tax=Mycena metata TaxID=1033252 RepID=A0AAD7H433_9AGAR|nr:hypothetical protein B0H16DRAFT_598993 [Mycena metata]